MEIPKIIYEMRGKLLDSSDRENIEGLVEKATHLMTLPIERKDKISFYERLDKYLDPNESRWHIFGCYHGEQLKAISAMIVHHRYPMWVGLDMFSNEPFPNGLYAIAACNDVCIWQADRLGLVSYICATSREHMRQFRMSRVRAKPDQWQWISFVEATIPPNEKPNTPFYWEMLGEKTWDTELVVWRGVSVKAFRGRSSKAVTQALAELARETSLGSSSPLSQIE